MEFRFFFRDQHSSSARNATVNKTLEEKQFSKQEKDGMLGGMAPEGGTMVKGPEWERYSQTKLANSIFLLMPSHNSLGSNRQWDS